MDNRQKYLFMALPIVFIFFIVNFPMGLMLYWTTTNLWTVGQGLVTRRLVPRPQPAPKRSSRTEPKSPGDGGGNGAKSPGPAPKPGPAQQKATTAGGQRVRRRKKRGSARR
jgi:YidC/Oxa1 family membrane protein insertase